MTPRTLRFPESLEAIDAQFTDIDADTAELLTVLAFMYAYASRDQMTEARRELRKVQAELTARCASRRHGESADEALRRLVDRRDALRDSLMHARFLLWEDVTTRIVSGVECPPTTVVVACEDGLLGSKRLGWWARFLFHGVTILRKRGFTRKRALAIMNELAGMIGHWPDARRLLKSRQDPERSVPQCDLMTRDADTVLDQYKKEKRRRRDTNAPPVLRAALVLKEKWRLRRTTIRWYASTDALARAVN